MDCIGTGEVQIVKKIEQASETADIIGDKQRVQVRIWNEGQDREQSIAQSIVTGAHQLTSNVEKVLLQMRVGDIWVLKVSNPILNRQGTINLQVVSTCDLPLEQAACLSLNGQVQKLKSAGNGMVKEKNYEKAIISYTEAYQLAKYACDSQAVELRLSILSNLALATLNSGKFRECLTWCSKYDRDCLDPNKKVAYRQASAAKGLREWKLARSKIETALRVWEGDKDTETDFKNLLQAVGKEEKLQMAKQKKVYANMFG